MFSPSVLTEYASSARELGYADIFPLSLTPFELFLLADDRQNYPMVFMVHLSFNGQIDPQALEQAVRGAVVRNPLLRSKLVWTGSQPRWVLANEDPPSVEWLTGIEIERGRQIHHIDLQKENGLRVLAQAGLQQSDIYLQFHHACCDGNGARRFIVDLLNGYVSAFSPNLLATKLDLLDYQALRTRGDFNVSNGSEKAHRKFSIWSRLRESCQFHLYTPKPILTPPTSNNSLLCPTIYEHVFSAEESMRFRNCASRLQINVNDIALSLLFQTLADWNKLYGCRDKDRLRVLMPIDLRSRSDARMSAVNRMGYSFLSRTIIQCNDLDSLMHGVCEETNYFKQFQTGRDFLASLDFARWIPGLLPLILGLPLSMATAILTNLGDPTRRFRRRFPSLGGAPVIGNVVLDYICGAPPIRSLTRAGFGICFSSGKMSISVAGDPACLGKSTSDLLLSYVERWRNWSGVQGL